MSVAEHTLPWNETTLTFVTAGKCYVSLERIADSTRHYYKVEQKVDMGTVVDPKTKQKKQGVVKRYDLWFVSLVIGAIGDSKPRYLGVIDKKGANGSLRFRTTKGTAKNKKATAENINAFGDMLRDLGAGLDNGHQTRIWHAGLCGRCGRALKVPESVATGIGPVCAKLMGIDLKSVAPSAIEKLAALAPAETPVESAQDSGAYAAPATVVAVAEAFAATPKTPETSNVEKAIELGIDPALLTKVPDLQAGASYETIVAGVEALSVVDRLVAVATAKATRKNKPVSLVSLRTA